MAEQHAIKFPEAYVIVALDGDGSVHLEAIAQSDRDAKDVKAALYAETDYKDIEYHHMRYLPENRIREMAHYYEIDAKAYRSGWSFGQARRCDAIAKALRQLLK